VSAAAPRPDNPLRAIGLKIASVAVFVAMSTLIKLAGPLPTGQVAFFRSFFAIPPILIFFLLQRELPGVLYTSRPFSHVARGFVGVCGMSLGFYGLARLPLPESITINYAQPLLVVVFSALILGETVRVYRWSAVTIGLLGVFIIVWPKLSLFAHPSSMGGEAAIGAVATLTAAVASALAMILVRSLVHTERTGTIVLWFSMTASVFTALTFPFGWSALTPFQLTALVLAGMCGGLGQLLMTEAYRYAEASVVAPFEYTSMILGVIIGYLVFGDAPTLHMLVGGVIVVGAGLFIILRERSLGIERRKARKAAAPE
jgi:Permeases of the drug/metabolite transporter (DMT) superfamily